eukprot:1292063-Alexandrium_andersonii.AAC.1
MDDFHSVDDGESDAEAAALDETRAEELARFEAVLAQGPEQFGTLGEDIVANALEQDPTVRAGSGQ